MQARENLTAFKMVAVKRTLGQAYAAAEKEIADLTDHMTGWEENSAMAETGLEKTPTFAAASAAARRLEDIQEAMAIDAWMIPNRIAKLKLTVNEFADIKARWRRLANATNNLEAITIALKRTKMWGRGDWDDDNFSVCVFVEALEKAVAYARPVKFPAVYA